MSRNASTAVWDHSKAPAPDLLVLLAIADAANADGREAWPGMPRLSQFSRKTESAVRRSIARLIAMGELIRVAEGHRGRSSEYAICLPGLAEWEERKAGADARLSDGERQASEDGKAGVSDAKGERLLLASPLSSTIEQEQRRARAEQFENFWQTYPMRNGRRLGRKQAEEQWRKLSDPEREQALVAARVYAKACAGGDTIAKDAFRWIRDRAFEEWALPAAAAPSRYRQPEQGPSVIRCPHGYPLSEDADGWSSPCQECDDVSLERAASEHRRAQLDAESA